MLRFLFHLFIIALLTVLTQVGGVVWLLYRLAINRWRPKWKRWQKLLGFIGVNAVVSIAILPLLAPLFGRQALPIFGNVVPCTYGTVLLNRHYTTPALAQSLNQAAEIFQRDYPDLKLVYLDANFPFWDGFPLLPHLSHDDGRKLDLSFIYTRKGKLTNRKPSVSGYGVYAGPTPREHNQTAACLNQGHWQYDFSKYLTFGRRRKLELANPPTKALIRALLAQPNTDKILLEPHLRSRLGLPKAKVRFHGCHAVRHDDHLHWQVK